MKKLNLIIEWKMKKSGKKVLTQQKKVTLLKIDIKIDLKFNFKRRLQSLKPEIDSSTYYYCI